jgi:hypothetical protein
MTNVKILTRRRIIVARLVAMSADAVQIGLFPLFGEGFVSPLNDILDVIVCIVLALLVGWHFAFLPGFIAELVPMVDLVPTWTIAVLIATRQKQNAPAGSSSVVVDDIASATERQEAQKLLPIKIGQDTLPNKANPESGL